MSTDPRIEALTRYIDGDLGFAAMSPRIRAEELRVSAGMLAHVDAADRAAGYVRVKADDATVEAVAKALAEFDGGFDDEYYEALASAVLEALVAQ